MAAPLSRHLVASLLLGALAGSAVALLLRAAEANTPVVVPPERLFWQWLLLMLGGAIAGLALRAVVELQASSNEPDYQRSTRRRGQRPPS